MATDPIPLWLAGLGVTLLSEATKEAYKDGKRALGQWLSGARGEEANALRAAVQLALDDFKRYDDTTQAEHFRAFLSEKQCANDTAFGDALLRTLLHDPSGIAALSPDLQPRVPANLHPAALAFLSHFHQRLWSQAPFDKLLHAKTAQEQLRSALQSLEYQRRAAEALERVSPPPDYATDEKRYLEQVIAKTELLEFVGIPDPRQNAAIKLEDIFVPLGAEEEIEQRDVTVFAEIAEAFVTAEGVAL